jgi:protein-disulfide isomerase
MLVTAVAGDQLMTAASAQQSTIGPSTPVPADTPDDTFGERVRAYLLAHPEVIAEAVQILQQRQQMAQTEAAQQTISTRADEIFHSPLSPVGGNPDGDVTLVEFFDYNCHYCRASAPALREILGNDRQLRFVYKEFPILGPGSTFAARAALAAKRQGKYGPLHDALFQTPESLTEESVLATAASVGLELERLKRDMADPSIAAEIKHNQELAAALGINGTPSWIVGEELIPGAVDRATLEQRIASVRQR